MIELLESRIEWIHERHDHWYSHMVDWAKVYGKLPEQTPKVIIKPAAPRRAGCYRHGPQPQIDYILSFAIVAGDDYDRAIAHEVCHAFQFALRPRSAGHGDFFQHLLQDVCGLKGAKTTHDYSCAKAKKVAAIARTYLKIRGLQDGTR